LVGFLVIMLMLPTLAAPYQIVIEQGIEASKNMLKLR
jgi:flagellar biosynthetic protein FliR